MEARSDRDVTGTNDGVRLPVSTVERGLGDMLTVHDEAGRYVYVSPSFEVFTGLSSTEVVGRTPFEIELLHPVDLERIVGGQASVPDDEPVRVETRLRRHDGAYAWVETLGNMLATPEGRRFVAVTREVSHVKSLQQSLAYERRLKQQLDDLVHHQQQILTTVSQRTRGPLATLVGTADLLVQHGEQLDDERRSILLDRVQSSSAKVTALLDELADVQSLNRSDAVLERRVVNIHKLATSVVDAATGPDGPVTNLVAGDCVALVDWDRVHRLLTILVGNALHHAGDGATVEILARRGDTGVELIVQDDGPGVPTDARQMIFEPYAQHDNTSQHGSGLGLYVVAELAALHGGRAWVDERPGGGARFHAWLPRPRGSKGPAMTRPDQEWGASALSPAAHSLVEGLLATLQARVGMGVVYLSILDDTHQHILATSNQQEVAGVSAGKRIPLEDTYCSRMVTDEIEHVIGDTLAHPRVSDLPFTEDGAACWIGVPVHLPSGQVFGSLCAASTEARPDLPQSIADEFATFAEILGQQLAAEGFIDGSVLDAAGRVTDVLTRSEALHAVLQPIVAISSGAVHEVEALLRVTDHGRPVHLWFADAARAGLLVDLEVHAMELALDELDRLPEDVALAINVSPVTVRSQELRTILERQPLHRLVLEVTEHAAVEDYQPLRTALDPLRADGLRLAIDDVGTGYSGLGHLVQLRPDIIKVDRSLVASVIDDPAHRAAAAGLARLADHAGALLVAEGIETETNLSVVRDIGFTHAQGYLLGRPSADLDLVEVEARTKGMVRDLTSG